MTKITITFDIPDEAYGEYENILDGFMNDIIEIGGTDFDTVEE